ncbi:putative MFS family arabinose efflux permease [Streptosporangium album]|uniref:Putative MFS family arabinose efflux permease n=1 Tax=Streptosporangium album TaxID=47479 RepID=A0A7W7WEN2_9ACTN|nr:hypothetical protein [Streptosporangium album]MBB4943559.1 putative MFS family arabinose efflux permease [Streptosporangium album]
MSPRRGWAAVGAVAAATFTYVRPALEEISGADAGLIGALLLAYGVAGVAGNFAGAAGAARSPVAVAVSRTSQDARE